MSLEEKSFDFNLVAGTQNLIYEKNKISRVAFLPAIGGRSKCAK